MFNEAHVPSINLHIPSIRSLQNKNHIELTFTFNFFNSESRESLEARLWWSRYISCTFCNSEGSHQFRERHFTRNMLLAQGGFFPPNFNNRSFFRFSRQNVLEYIKYGRTSPIN